MLWLPLILVIPILCFVGAYGIQKRTPWAWYAGWVVAFFITGAVGYFCMAILSNAETTRQLVCGLIFTAGGAALWTHWAVWWATHREEFVRKRDSE
jgi:hypothetical protein